MENLELRKKVAETKAAVTAAEQNLEQARRVYKEAIISFLNADSTLLTDQAEKILAYAEAQETNPIWLYGMLNNTATLVRGSHPMFTLMTTETVGQFSGITDPEQLYQKAVDIIRSEFGGQRRWNSYALEALSRAEFYALNEDPQRPLDQPMSVVYHWLGRNTDVLYDIRYRTEREVVPLVS